MFRGCQCRRAAPASTASKGPISSRPRKRSRLASRSSDSTRSNGLNRAWYCPGGSTASASVAVPHPPEARAHGKARPGHGQPLPRRPARWCRRRPRPTSPELVQLLPQLLRVRHGHGSSVKHGLSRRPPSEPPGRAASIAPRTRDATETPRASARSSSRAHCNSSMRACRRWVFGAPMATALDEHTEGAQVRHLRQHRLLTPDRRASRGGRGLLSRSA